MRSPHIICLQWNNYAKPRKILGNQIAGHIVNNLRYADGTVLPSAHLKLSIAGNEEDLQQLLQILEGESTKKKKGLELNSRKTKAKVVIRNNKYPQINIFINIKILKQSD